MASHHPDVHLVETEFGPHLLFVDGSRLYAIDHDLQQRLEATLCQAPDTTLTLLAEHGITVQHYVDSTPLQEPPVRALSLAVAQKCNLGWTKRPRGGLLEHALFPQGPARCALEV